MQFELPSEYQDERRIAIVDAYMMDETVALDKLIPHATFSPEALQRVQKTAGDLVAEIRELQAGKSGVDSFMAQYHLDSDEGIALMCIAEALLRIPDKSTIDKLIRDKIVSADWQSHVGKSTSFFVNAATWGLLLTGKVLEPYPKTETTHRLRNKFKNFLERSSEPVIRKAISQAMKIMSRQFVKGRTIEEALQRSVADEKKGFRFSYDMLGEAARTAQDADRYFEAYNNAIEKIGQHSGHLGVIAASGISIKLSALHPRYEFAQRDRVLEEMTPKLFALAQAAKQYNIPLTIDAEETARLDLSLDMIQLVLSDPGLDTWDGFGLAVQAYQKRAFYVIDWLAHLAKRTKKQLKVRLVKGAYWDTEVKLAQMQGIENYPVFTRKTSTDISYLACAKKLISQPQAFYPQFATHNAFSVAAILEMMGDRRDFEFQCLHGMGRALYEQIVPAEKYAIPCRIYAPVGSHEDLLPYLVRRLLENGANTSFVNRIVDANAPIDALIEDPVHKLRSYTQFPHPNIPLPKAIFGATRLNSQGFNFTHPTQLANLFADITVASQKSWRAGPIIGGHEMTHEAKPVYSPQNRQMEVGVVQRMTAAEIEKALSLANEAHVAWELTQVDARAHILEHAAELFEKHRPEFMSLLIREAGKTLKDAISEIREAVDFLRYYAAEARRNLIAEPLTGYTGEENTLHLRGRGIFLCISPWNFPLAIFTGQVSAALATGNCVLAKPSEQTPLIAALAIRLLHAAGIPDNVLHLLPGPGSLLGKTAVVDERVKGVIFTGSTETARIINAALASRPGAIVPFIAETGGQNAMIVDSSALAEQVVEDVLTSAFGSAGQRCSALRVLYLQEEVADSILRMLKGAMAELRIGDPADLKTDVGPVIDEPSRKMLREHLDFLQQHGKLIYQMPLPENCEAGTFLAPAAYEIENIQVLKREVFGPILHVIRYPSNKLDQVIADINGTGYGLTLGIHSRISDTVEYILKRAKVGNSYVNRNMIGAIVGLQPFGGEGLSGTGPKAGGPLYPIRLCTERTVTINTTAAGGNTSLMTLED